MVANLSKTLLKHFRLVFLIFFYLILFVGKMNKQLLIILFLGFFNLFLRAQSICTASVNGDWANASTWSCGHVPVCGETVVIPTGISVTITNQQDYSSCTPTPAMSPQIYIDGVLKFTNGNKLKLPCGSNVYIGGTGSLVPGTGGGNSNYLEICTDIVWNAASGTTSGPFCYPPGCSLIPLPIEFIAFTGNLEVKVVFLHWKTATEKNNSHFDIEKSSDGINYTSFTSVKTKAPNGTSYGVLEYSAIDYELKHPLYYYRLKQFDLDGTFIYSKSITVKVYSPELKIYPNPNNGQFKVDVPTALTNQHVDVKIYDQLSQPVLNSVYTVLNDNITGATVDILPAKPLAKGVYFASIIFDGIEYRVKLVVN